MAFVSRAIRIGHAFIPPMRSAEGSSSGLHHDFHDNLYILLRGQKRFRLFSPADAHRCVASYKGNMRFHTCMLTG